MTFPVVLMLITIIIFGSQYSNMDVLDVDSWELSSAFILLIFAMLVAGGATAVLVVSLVMGVPVQPASSSDTNANDAPSFGNGPKMTEVKM